MFLSTSNFRLNGFVSPLPPLSLFAPTEDQYMRVESVKGRVKSGSPVRKQITATKLKGSVMNGTLRRPRELCRALEMNGESYCYEVQLETYHT